MTEPLPGPGGERPDLDETVLPVTRGGLVAVSAGEKIVAAPGSEAAVAAAAAAGGEVHYWFPVKVVLAGGGEQPPPGDDVVDTVCAALYEALS
ncbi:hypothetical protein [Kitasatospora sp. NPDC050543]|uniref:hypothetical protein n=1 Tax=Kitasatospora sp. NPDC050543 TaxID=3364054 RepID=UPI0037B14C1D